MVALVGVVAGAVLVMAALKVALTVTTPRERDLPSPQTIGLPWGKLATPAEVDAVLGGRPAQRRS